MSTTVGSIETSAREIVNDDQEGSYRWLTPAVLRFVWDGVRKLQKIRPESRYVGLRLMSFEFPRIPNDADSQAIEEARAEILPVDDRWTDALVDYVAHRCFASDDNDTENARLSAEHMNNFIAWSAQ